MATNFVGRRRFDDGAATRALEKPVVFHQMCRPRRGLNERFAAVGANDCHGSDIVRLAKPENFGMSRAIIRAIPVDFDGLNSATVHDPCSARGNNQDHLLCRQSGVKLDASCLADDVVDSTSKHSAVGERIKCTVVKQELEYIGISRKSFQGNKN